VLTFQGIHAEILEDQTGEIDVEGARMSGKTWTISEKIRRSCLKYPGIWWLICRYSGTETDNQLRPQFRQVCSMQGTPVDWHDDESAYWFPEVGGKQSKVFAFGLKTQSKDQRYAKIRGSGFNGVWNDQSEELPEDIGTEIRALLRRPDYPSQLIFSPNPPDEEHFLADQFPDDQDEPGRKYYRLSLYDNRHNLKADTIEKLEKAYPISHAKHKSLILGQRGPNIVGVPVYDGAFNRDLHIAKIDIEPQLPLIESFHAGQHHPSWLVVQRSPYGAAHVLGGIIGKKLFLEDFLPLVDTYREAWFPDRQFVTVCDPPPSRDDQGRFTSINILREHKLKLRWRENSNSPDVRESVIQNIAGMMKRRLGPSQGFLINADESRWLMASLAKVKHTRLFMDSAEGSYVWDENLVSVGNKKVRQPKVNQWLEGQQRCLENIVLNCFAGKETEDEKRQRRRESAEYAPITPVSSPNSWLY
jgi:hypothetical protein